MKREILQKKEVDKGRHGVSNGLQWWSRALGAVVQHRPRGGEALIAEREKQGSRRIGAPAVFCRISQEFRRAGELVGRAGRGVAASYPRKKYCPMSTMMPSRNPDHKRRRGCSSAACGTIPRDRRTELASD